MEPLEFEQGGLEEDFPWKISFDYLVYRENQPCQHCHSKHISDDYFKEVAWICPRVVIARNEGGWSSTAVCLDCILEAAQDGLPIPPPVIPIPCKS